MRPESIALIAIASLHLIMGLLHNHAHLLADVQNTPFQLLFILLVVTVAPWIAVYLAWKGSLRMASALFASSMGASFLFGYLLHFFLESPDLHSNVTGEHLDLFLHSAIGLALVEFSGFVLGAYIFFRSTDPH